jgi:hypothetical protein
MLNLKSIYYNPFRSPAGVEKCKRVYKGTRKFTNNVVDVTATNMFAWKSLGDFLILYTWQKK